MPHRRSKKRSLHVRPHEGLTKAAKETTKAAEGHAIYGIAKFSEFV